MKPTVSQIKKWGLQGKSAPVWGGFKHKLVEAGVIENTSCDVPEAWKRAYCKACKRPYPML